MKGHIIINSQETNFHSFQIVRMEIFVNKVICKQFVSTDSYTDNDSKLLVLISNYLVHLFY